MNFKLLTFFLLLGLLIASCDDDDDPETPFQAPRVTAPSDVQAVDPGQTGLSVTFDVSIDNELTATYQATGSGVTISNASGDVSGSSVTINYDAGTSSGAGSINLEVTDSDGQSDDATAVINVGEVEEVVRLTDNISGEVTWTADKVYVLGGRITVLDGATLTIEPGTIIKGEAGTGANATALLVARGGTLMADGTPEAPIIFTSVADEIVPENVKAGNFGSPNLDPDINGLWGGVIVLGRARISASSGGTDLNEVQIEGIPTSDPNGLYGGNDDDDNSGVIRYISIRHGGANIGAGNEINGLTLGGIGRNTVVENIEVVANQDDGIEWFGGTVNTTNALMWNVGDDGVDTDQSWSGTLDNFIVVTPSGHCFELDGPEGSYANGHTVKNGTVIVSDLDNERFSEDIINTDDNSIVDLENIFLTSIADGQVINRTEHTEGTVNFTNIKLDVDPGSLESFIDGPVPAGITAGGSPVADKSVFSWTWAAQAGGLDDI